MAVKKAKTDKTVKVKKVKFTGFAPLNFKEHTITQKRSGRFQVVNSKGDVINGSEKEKLLLDSKVLKGSFKKAATEEAAVN